ncbi:MAG: hypothetical protein DRI61_11305 [Chloroflexi bacterium]|nr:MAG: hypothetical protein DRI61_11305 [Chloroflexota bacterium]
MMGDNFLADLHRAVTRGKVEVWVSVREDVSFFDPNEDTHPTTYYISTYQDIVDVIWKDLKRYIGYDEWEATLVTEEIWVDGAEYFESTKLSTEEIWEVMKKGRKVEIKFGWFYS